MRVKFLNMNAGYIVGFTSKTKVPGTRVYTSSAIYFSKKIGTCTKLAVVSAVGTIPETSAT